MIDLAKHIKECYHDRGLTSLHLFRNGEKWHCNVSDRDTETWGSTDSVDPVKAMMKAIEICSLQRNAVERARKPLSAPAADDLL